MKMNVIKTIVDTSELRKSIKYFELSTNHKAILLMNDKTRKALEDKCMISNGFIPLKGLATLKAYDGRKIFTDNDLEYGEIDIR